MIALNSFLVVKHLFFILKALEYKIPLFIFKLPYLIISPHVIILQPRIRRARVLFLPSPSTVILIIPRVKHMCTQIQHRPLINLTIFRVPVRSCHRRQLRVILHELWYTLHKLTLLPCLIEPVTFQVRQTDQQMHKDWRRDLIFQ